MPPIESRQNIIPVARRCVKTLRWLERPVDCEGIRHRFRRRGLVRARAAPRGRIRDAGRCGRGGTAPPRRNRSRRPLAGGARNEKKCQISLRTIIGIFMFVLFFVTFCLFRSSYTISSMMAYKTRPTENGIPPEQNLLTPSVRS